MQVKNIFLLFYWLCQGASCGKKEQPGYLNCIQPQSQGSAALHSAVASPVVFVWEQSVREVAQEIPVIKGRVDRWVGEEDDSVMTVFLPVYSTANTTQAWIELPQNIACEVAQDLASGIHSACTDHI